MRSSRPTTRGRSRRPIHFEHLEARTLLTTLPTGAVSTFNRTTVAGYAANSDDGQLPQNIEITVNGVKSTLTADDFRVDLIGKYGSPYHAFSFEMPTLPAGISKILVQAVSPTTGARATLRSGTITNPVPKGKVEVISDTQIKGYAYDTDTALPIQVRIDIDGVAGTPFATNVARPDLVSRIGSKYTTPGFDVTGDFAGKVVEVWGLDDPTGTAVLLYTNNKRAFGKVEVNNGFALSGWALDPNNTSESIQVKVTIDGTEIAGSPFTANVQRDDLVLKYGNAFHGFNIIMPALTPGAHTVAVYAIDGQATSAAPVFVGSARVNNTPPQGKLDVTSTDTLLTGWALDRDLGADAATVNLYVDAQYYTTVLANLPRTNFGGISPTPNHGFSFDISALGTSSHAITLTVLDNRSGENEVVFYDGFVNNQKPTGMFEPIVNDILTGWAYDADDPNYAALVDVYINGVYRTTITADQAREDVDALFPTPNHAFLMELPTLPFGTHKIELYAAESQLNVSVLIGVQYYKVLRPVGMLEVATPTTLSGYVGDADHLGESLEVRVYINGVLDPSLTTMANLDRPDLLTKKPFSTMPSFANYGFSITLPTLNAGRNQVDVYVVDAFSGMLSPIASRAITV